MLYIVYYKFKWFVNNRYSTGNEITDITNQIHNTFPSEVEPVLLLVDTTLSDKKLGIKVFKR